jgi:DNA polymerase-1
VRKYFSQTVVCDSEYEAAVGGLPNVLCMVAYVLDEYLRHVRTIRLWRGEFGRIPPFDTGPDTLFVAYSAWAELTCFQVLGWKFPAHVFDQHTAYLAASNILLPYNPDEKRSRPSKRLPDACRAYGIEGWERIDKKGMAEDIGNGLWQKYGREGVIDYCEEDVKKSTELLRAQLRDRCDYRERIALPAADVERVLHWSNYSAKSVALIQARGMPIDVPLWNTVQEDKNKKAVIGELLRRFDPSYGDEETIYTPDGEWSYDRFERYLVRHGVYAWPRLDSGQLDIDSDAFRLMYHVPGIEELHALRDSIGFINKARLPIGPDGRNRPSLFPFGTATGRNAHARSPYNAHAAVRSFMLFPPGSIGAYLDWRTQEVGVAAVWSGDEALKNDYAAGDIYHALARMCGLTNEPDPFRWKKSDPGTRDRMKKLQLGISYGMGVPSLARGLDRHPLIASAVIELYRRKHSVFWKARADSVVRAMLDRRVESKYGWPLRLTTSPNRRTLYNFPMQSGGAEMLRLAAWRLCEAGIVPIMLIHDGILFEETDPEKIELAREIMLQAGRDVCDGFEIGVSTDQYLVGADSTGGARYYDSRPMAKKLWSTIMDTLEMVGAVSKRSAA